MLKKDLLDEWGGFNCKLKLFRLVLIWKMASFFFVLVFWGQEALTKSHPLFDGSVCVRYMISMEGQHGEPVRPWHGH